MYLVGFEAMEDAPRRDGSSLEAMVATSEKHCRGGGFLEEIKIIINQDGHPLVF